MPMVPVAQVRAVGRGGSAHAIYAEFSLSAAAIVLLITQSWILMNRIFLTSSTSHTCEGKHWGPSRRVSNTELR